MSSNHDPNELLTSTSTSNPTVDSQISLSTSRAYWESIDPSNNGMLGGFEDVTGPDLRASKIFFTQVQRILGNTSSPSSSKASRVNLAVDCGAGIGRITKGLLVHIAKKVDAVEPIAKFAVEIERYRADHQQQQQQNVRERTGQVDEIFVQGLEDWSPPPGKKYDLIWNQWCLGHLTDDQLVRYLRRAAQGLSGIGSGDGLKNEDTGNSNGGLDESIEDSKIQIQTQAQKGWIMVKENLTRRDDSEYPTTNNTTSSKSSKPPPTNHELEAENEDEDLDLFDEQDSSVTRSNKKFRQIFEQAGLNVIRAQRQKGFPGELFPVMMYALRPKVTSANGHVTNGGG